ncbi:MAG TPA: nuclear transport factor 2 family protein [Flavipsychrobacter sp.]|nr:nuclear transport factor 2 family protein [Flavipsychrobacter sp.]
MENNEQLIHTFYISFQNKDYKGMQACYNDEATFSDPVFKDLDSKQVKAMWQMLITRAKDMTLIFSDVKADDKTGSCRWVANYMFSATGRKVKNEIVASFEFKDGKIIKHRDNFNFYKWASQALGTTGKLLGWTNFLHKKVSKNAMKNLEVFMSKL